MKKLFALLLCAALLAIGSLATAEDVAALFSDGLDGYNAGDYAKAFECWSAAAEQGHATAIYNLGTLYENGQGTDASIVRARDLYEQAAELGEQSAIQQTAYHYYYDYEGLEPDYEEAAKWFTVLAEGGDTDAMFRLGEIYRYFLKDVKAHDEIALSWFEEGALAGDVNCIHRLGTWYRDGRVVQQSKATAKILFEQAAESAHLDAMVDLANLLLEDGEKNYGKARYWFNEAANLGCTDVSVYEWLGYLYCNDSENYNYDDAVYYYEKAVAMGSGYAMYHLGLMYRDGTHFDVDLEKARAFFTDAVAAGYEGAQTALEALDASLESEADEEDAEVPVTPNADPAN